MARFYFHLRNEMSVDDEEGLELPDVTAARVQAEQFALDMAAVSMLEQRRLNLNHSIEVTNEAGQDVLRVRFGDVVNIEG